MITSKLTRKAQTTLPRAVREALRLRPGDEVGYVIEGPGRVVMVRATPDDDPFATFTEWSGDADREAYAEL
jgi:antitoxin PrlF